MKQLRFIAIALLMACNGAAPRPQAPDSMPGTPGSDVVSQRIDSTGRYPVVLVTGEPALGTIDSMAVVRDDFRSVRSVLLDPAGGVWVLDDSMRRVTRYDDQGGRTTMIGAPGTGAGQFATPYSIAWGAGDLMVYDPGNSRVGRWRPDGTWVGSWRAVPITGANARFFPSGSSSSAWLFQFSFLSTGQPAPGFARFPLTPRGDVRWILPTVGGGVQNVVICTEGTSQRRFSAPFTLGETWQPALGADLLFVHGTDYRIATVDSAGDTLRAVHREIAQDPITDAEWEAGTRELEAFRGANPGACNGTFTRPAGKAVVRALTLDDRGRIWVERVTPSGFVWDVWEGDRLVGAVPGVDRDQAVPVDIRGDRMAVAVRSGEAVPAVRVYRFRLPG